MKAYTVTIEHGPPGERSLSTFDLEASSFDHAVLKAKKGLIDPRAMSVVDYGKVPERSDLFEGVS